MKVKVYHNGDLIEENNWLDGTTPQGVKSWHKRHDGKHGYDVMIGATDYFVKSCSYANNDVEIVVKVSTQPTKEKE